LLTIHPETLNPRTTDEGEEQISHSPRLFKCQVAVLRSYN